MLDPDPHRRSRAGQQDWPPRRTELAISLVAALLVVCLIVAANLVLSVPPVRDRADLLVLQVRSEIKKRRPHDLYVPTPAATATAAVRALAPSTAAPTPTVTPEPTPTPGATPLPASVQHERDCHEYQGWNNCGPSTLAMALRFYGWTQDQYTVAAATKPDKDDKNVSPDEMVAYASSLGGLHAALGYATDTQVLKLLLSNGFPVIVETWFIPEPGDEMGHYRLLTGYDDVASEFIAQDSYNGPDQRVPYDELERMWKVFNRVYVVVCEAERAAELSALLGETVERENTYRSALSVARSEIEADPEDRYAWFNAGTNLVGLGQHEDAAAAYDRARVLQLPWRMLWYQFGPFEAYLNADRYQDVIDLASANLKAASNLEESYYYRALARRALGDEAGARQDLESALRYNPLYAGAQEALGERSTGER